MRKAIHKAALLGDSPNISAQSPEKKLIQTFHEIHNGMVKQFHVDFPFFRKVNVVEEQKFSGFLAERMQLDLKGSGIPRSHVQLKQLPEMPTHGQKAGLTEHFAFYSPQTDTLYLNETMVTRFPEKVFSVCAHELAEKLLSVYVSPSTLSSAPAAVKLYVEVTKTSGAQKFRELLDFYMNTVFITIFKEGCCEAIAVQTLRSMRYSKEAEGLEKELLAGYPKCISLLTGLEEIRKNWARIDAAKANNPLLVAQRLAKDVIRRSQVIKGVSYYVGYPVAKAVLEKYGLEGVRFAVEKSPPLETQYFVNPQTYLVKLEKALVPNAVGR
jgi:hypothetical protein